MNKATHNEIINHWKQANIPVALLDCANQNVLWISESAAFLLTETGDVEKSKRLINNQFCNVKSFASIKKEITHQGMSCVRLRQTAMRLPVNYRLL